MARDQREEAKGNDGRRLPCVTRLIPPDASSLRATFTVLATAVIPEPLSRRCGPLRTRRRCRAYVVDGSIATS